MKNSPARQWDWASIVIFITALTFSAWRLIITRWTSDLGYVQQLVWLGSLLGLVLGYSRFGRRGVVLLSIGYTLVLIPNRFVSLYDADIYLGERLMSLLGRWLFSIQEFVLANPVKDQLFFVTILSVTYWFIGLFSGYHLIRYRNYLVAILPAGMIMLVIQVYDAAFPSRIWLLAVYIFLSLVLLGRQNYLQNRDQWRLSGTQVSPETGIDLNTGTLIAAALILIAAWTLPASIPRVPTVTRTWDRLTRPWRDTRDRLGDAFASVTGSQTARGDFYRDELYLGANAPLSDDLVFTVYAPPEAQALPRLYWRGRVYDTFDRGRWITSAGVEEMTFWPSKDEFAVPDTGWRTVFDFTFNMFINRQATLYVAAQPVWVSRPVEAVFMENPEAEQDIFVLLASPYLEPGEIYHTRAAMANPSINELRAAGEDYPAWVVRRYLQLPDGFSPRIAELAQSVTAGLNNPYDKAAAVTAYLRDNIEYATALQFPETPVDPLEYVLFESKKGFCNYYASAEVLMLRSLGIPSRMAVGFAQGEENNEDNVFAVRQRDAHAWPEVYFPGYGWIEFEPTGNQDPLERPEYEEASPDEAAPLSPPQLNPLELGDFENPSESEQAGQDQNPAYLASLLLYLTVAVSLAALYVMLNRRYDINTRLPVFVRATMERTGMASPAWLDFWISWTSLTPMERSFETINRSLRLLDEPPAVYHTPAERAQALATLLPKAKTAIHTLVAEHQSALFTTHPGDGTKARRASLTIWLRTRQAILERLWKNFIR